MRFLLILLLALPWVTHAAEDLLEPEQAFRLAARVAGPDALEVRYRIAAGYYMYRDKFQFTLAPGTAHAPQLPPGKLKRDEFFGEVETYRDEVRIRLPFEPGAADARSLTLTAVSQGCADAGVCYTPQEQRVVLQLAGVNLAAGGPFIEPARESRSELVDMPGAGASDTRIAELFGGGFWLLLASFFGFGLLLSFTPCVLPMFPILSGIIVGHGKHVTKARGFALSAAYVLGMAMTYALAGVAAGLSGAMLSAVLQNPWVVGSFAAIFVVLAFAMFGFYELQLPVGLQTRLAQAANHLPGGQFSGVFAMGVLSALIVGPCVAAPLAGALLYISQSRDVVLGGSALFAMALGMGVPLLALGASAGTLLPKAGPWMDAVKRFFGALLLAVAIYLVSPFVPAEAQMLLWAALLIMSGIYMHALDPLPHGAHGFQRFAKGLGVIALLAGAVYLIGALSGGRDVLQPLAGLRAGAPAAQSAVAFQRVNSLAELDGAIRAAAGRPVMLDFYADWCVTCKEMERYTFSDAQVRVRFEQLVKLQADVTANTADHAALLKRFRLFGPPGIVFFDRSGREIQGLRVIGFQPAGKFAAVLDEAINFK